MSAQAHRAAIRRRRLVPLLAIAALGATLVGVLPGLGSPATPSRASPSVRTGGLAPRPLDAASFAAGACMLYRPTAGDRGQTVFLDAGGGGYGQRRTTTTPVGGRAAAADAALRIVTYAVSLLRARGFTVVASRSGPGLVARPLDTGRARTGASGAGAIHRDLAARVRCANRSRAALMVSVELGPGGGAAATGAFAAYEPQRPFAERNLQLAELLAADITHRLGGHGWHLPALSVEQAPTSGGSATRRSTPWEWMLLGPRSALEPAPTAMPGAGIVPLELAHSAAMRIAASRTGQRAIADGLTEAIMQFLPLSPRPAHTLQAAFRGERIVARSMAGTVPLALVWRLPSAGPGQGPITVAAFNSDRTRLVLHAGTTEPGATGPWLNGPQVGPNERSQLVAAFNAGFKMVDARGGWVSEGRTAVPLVKGAASVVIYADGGTDIGSWGTEVPAANRPIASVRQNLQLLINHGRAQLQHAVDESQLEQWWGITYMAAPLVSRSALGLTANGTLVWAAGTDVSIPALTDALLAHGVVRAIELDINAPLVRGFLYPGAGRVLPAPAPSPALPLVAGQTQTALDYTNHGSGNSSVPHCTYIATCSRDFFTVITR